MSGDGYPLGADCDVDALVSWRMRELDTAVDAAVAFAHELQRILCPWLPTSDTIDAILAPLSVQP